MVERVGETCSEARAHVVVSENARVYTPPVVAEVAHRNLQFFYLCWGSGQNTAKDNEFA